MLVWDHTGMHVKRKLGCKHISIAPTCYRQRWVRRSNPGDGSSQWLDLGHMGSYGKVGETAEDDQPRTWAFLMHPDEAFTAAYARVKPQIIEV